MNAFTDEHLMQQVKDGKTDKLSLLFDRYNHQIFNFFLKFSGNQEISKDLTQNVFLRVLKYKTSYSESKSFKSWIYQIARNVRIDNYRESKIQHRAVEISYYFENNISIDENNTIEKKEELALLQNALMKMPHEKREILIMSQLQNIKHKEIAEILGITENAARVKIFRAIKELSVLFKMISK